jgi:hypothetical protein
MEACYGGTDVMERSCAMARGKDISIYQTLPRVKLSQQNLLTLNQLTPEAGVFIQSGGKRLGKRLP